MQAVCRWSEGGRLIDVQILVLGMHRSGTSMVARLLNMMGAYFGLEGSSIGANQENPKGFWERRDVRALNDMLLHSAGADWDRLSNFALSQIPEPVLARFKREAARIILEMDAHRPWFLKEPRLCVLASLWLDLLEFPVCLFVYRSPLEVARSLETRNGFDVPFSLALWERYTSAALNATLGRRRLQMNHADLMSDPVGSVRGLAQNLEALGIHGLRAPSNEEILAFIDPSLYRWKEREIGRSYPLTAAQRRLRDAFQTGKALLGTKPVDCSADSHYILACHDQVLEAQNKIAELATNLSDLTYKLEQNAKVFDELQKKVAEQAEAIERRNLWREGAEKRVAELKSTVSRQREAIERRNHWRESAEQRAMAAEKAGSEATARLEKRLSEKDAAIERHSSENKALRTELERANAHEQDLERQLAIEARVLEAEKTAMRKLRELLKKAATELDRVRRSSRWKAGSLVLFRPSKIKGPSAHEKYVGAFDSWRNQQKTDLARHRNDSGEGIPPNQAGASSVQTSSPLPAASEEKLASPKAEFGAAHVSPGQVGSLREFEIDSVERIIAQLRATVSIVVPIYNGANDLERCVESVLRYTTVPFQLILVDDCSSDPAVGVLLAKYEAHDAIRVLRQRENRGFVHSANAGMHAAVHDVVLLNSDTEVTPRWLQKLIIAAYSHPQIATVTPFSNAAGAFSVPETGVNTPIPFPFTPLKMSRLTERLSTRAYPEVPTGNGFCMFIKRPVLDEIGGFDEENFGRGYGEENDFCMRARQAGWRSVIDDSLFVYHRGNSSFGDEKQGLIKRNRATLDRLHPAYTRLVREFTASADINALRARIGDALRHGAPELQLEAHRILYILHEGTGGVPMTNADLVSKVSDTQQCFLLTSSGTEMILREWRNGRAVERQRWRLQGLWSAENFRQPAMAKIYFQVLVGLGIDLVHIRHLFKHSFDPPFLCRALGIPAILSFHDYYFICPSIHLLDQNAKFCGGRCTPGLEQCTIPSPLLKDLPMLKGFVPQWRERVAQLFDCCDAFVTTAESVHDLHLSAFPQLRQKPFWVIEHGRDLKCAPGVPVPPRPGESIRILAPGNIGHSKGSHFIREMKQLDFEELIEFHFLGKTDEALRDIGVHHGAYKRDNFEKLVGEIRPSFAAVFSIWAETYSHTLTEAWAVGLPVLGSKLGAVGERIAKHGGGWIVDTSDPAGTLAQIRAIAGEDGVYHKALREVENIQFQTVEGMAQAYHALYEQLLASPISKNVPRVGCLIPPGDRGSTFVRVTLPLAHEKMQERLFAVRLPIADVHHSLGKWIDRLGLQTIFLQREALEKDTAVAVVETCRARNMRVVFEVDDNLLDLAESHADYAFYESRIETIRYLAEKADQVVVSTANLLEIFRPLNKRICIVGNAIDEWLWFGPLRIAESLPLADRLVAGYMGTKTHRADLEMIREPFLRARQRLESEHHIRLDLQIIGGLDDDPAASRWYRRLEIPKGCKRYPRFVRWLRQTVVWDFALAPLQSEPLNQSKSALKFFEYASLGLPGIFSRVGEYSQVIQDKESGLLVNPDHPEAWEDAIVEMAASPALREKLAVGARRQTRERHLLGDKVPSFLSVLQPV